MKEVRAQVPQAAFGLLLPYVLFSPSTWLPFCIPKIQRRTTILQAATTDTHPPSSRMYQGGIDSNQEASDPLSPLKS